MIEIRELERGFTTAFIDYNVDSNLALRPQFISNNSLEGRKVLTSIEEELHKCDEFFISVAFITMGGITPLLQTLKELEERGIKGRILTTNYLSFSEPRALEKLNELSNIELRMYDVENSVIGFHTKGYIFRKEALYQIIVGSSNMTLHALTVNKEWNTRITSTVDGEYSKEIQMEFEQLWSSDKAKSYLELKDYYTIRYELIKQQKSIAKKANIPSIVQYSLEPNEMQMSFIRNLQKLQREGEERALLISATGTGKTYAAAFAMRSLQCKRVLFLVHRKQIAKQALKSFENIFGNSKTMTLLADERKNKNNDFVFATMQTMAKEEVMHLFAQDAFDAIIIDEAHHSTANSYQQIMQYFKPILWLGMTATPDKREAAFDNKSIYEIFNYKIACEIRLQQAMEIDLLCPFHYFGITDLEFVSDGKKDKINKLREFSLLTSTRRAEYIIEKANFYGYSGNRVKGLIFCSRLEEAKILSIKFNESGLRTIVLSGSDKETTRDDAIERLAGEENEEALDYIFSVDVFSEGVDIPEINQVIMLRPTESPIVFIQQLGRGLRKAEDKEYVVILDFIGNYTNNFMIPIALSGDRTYNKDNIRKYVMEGTRIIPGSSSIHFDEISKKKIFESIDKTTTKKKFLIEKYLELKNKLGKIPSIVDFYKYSEVDPMLFLQYSKTYYYFLKNCEKSYQVQLQEKDENILEFVCMFLANGKRPYELIILEDLIHNKEVNFENIARKVKQEYLIEPDAESYYSSLNLLEGKFMNTQSEKKKYGKVKFIEENMKGQYQRAISFYRGLQNLDFKHLMQDVIKLGLMRYKDKYITEEGNLRIYEKYSRKDVCRLLNWERDDSSTIYGYKIKYNTCPIFVTYKKDDSISESTQYADAFLNQKVFSWMTRSTGAWREEAKTIMNYQTNHLKIYLFIKKSDGEGSDFYYMGRAIPSVASETINKNGAPIMNILLSLHYAVREDIYDYLMA